MALSGSIGSTVMAATSPPSPPPSRKSIMASLFPALANNPPLRCHLRNWWELSGVMDFCRELFPVGETCRTLRRRARRSRPDRLRRAPAQLAHRRGRVGHPAVDGDVAEQDALDLAAGDLDHRRLAGGNRGRRGWTCATLLRPTRRAEGEQRRRDHPSRRSGKPSPAHHRPSPRSPLCRRRRHTIILRRGLSTVFSAARRSGRRYCGRATKGTFAAHRTMP